VSGGDEAREALSARVAAFARLLGRTTAKLRRTDRAAYEALVAAGQDIVARMRGGAL
jgi:hypothetical protein